ncbi:MULTISPECIES: hypothetical protein [Paenibacillus]|jgi:hypothetical protein|uniref:FeS oxidoreductase n=1 Tax=Paenibacillus alvei TaxID=44250 RepID=A0A383RBN3_PAEAL|nr:MULTISPECIES: hypothetical protein [Paenibacillus]GAV11209.1 FeS oxidoreductase [Paenibacillus sp. NAIST15-1]SYX84517.1 FeS oxidoreductase [Paenibacillus alvei]
MLGKRSLLNNERQVSKSDDLKEMNGYVTAKLGKIGHKRHYDEIGVLLLCFHDDKLHYISRERRKGEEKS